MTAVTVHDVAAFLLARSGNHLAMSAIHRMAYYAQGWHLAWAGTPLFDEDIRIRKTGPVVHELFAHSEGFTETTWPAGNAAAITGTSAKVLESVFNSYGHMTGIGMGQLAHKEAPCVLAMGRKTAEDSEPVVDPADMKAFFKALDDAPAGQTAYANRFMDKYADPVLDAAPPVEHTLIGPSYATASLGDEDHAGWYWKCSCGAKAASFIGNWPESKEEAIEEWELHRE
ncbi:MAG TPA: type II toxin-antitoxin system antitoxin SocA domain-containing protein [Arthrobacter sp.]